MKAAIHQPHYFPWIGYFDKMAKSDVFVLLDQVQCVKRSQMLRNRIINTNGELQYITITSDTNGFLEKEYREIPAVDNDAWTKTHYNRLSSYYRNTVGYQELMPILEKFYRNDYKTVCEWTVASVFLLKEIFEIDTKIIMQSDVQYDHSNKKSDMIRAICQSIGADIYFSGRGASVEYLNRKKFSENGITIIFQEFSHPIYHQRNTKSFIPGISSLDFLFNCGIEESRRIFWRNVRSTHEFN